MRIILLLLFALVGFVTGCIRPVTVQERETHRAIPADTARSMSQPFDPVEVGKDVFDEELSNDTTKASENIEILGYRVQLAAFGDEASARDLQVEASSKFAGEVHLIHEPPFWCVRLGDFVTMEEADSAKKEVLAKGYKGAWIVGDKVLRKE
jgi:hypothetical protein